MKVGVKIKIDVSKIDKAQLYKGQKGTYLTVTSFIDLDNKDQYENNGMVTQEIDKQLRDQGQKGAILGNAQVFWSEGGSPQQAGGFQPQQPAQGGFQPQPQAVTQMAQQQVDDFDTDQIPF
jgi:hypothetical protein